MEIAGIVIAAAFVIGAAIYLHNRKLAGKPGKGGGTKNDSDSHER